MSASQSIKVGPLKKSEPLVLLFALKRSQRESAIESCRKLTNKIDKGLDLSGEIRAVLAQRTGVVVLTYALSRCGHCSPRPQSRTMLANWRQPAF
jgi:hypothetical protein